MRPDHSLGARIAAKSTGYFRVWAPYADTVELKVITPSEQIHRLRPSGNGYFAGEFEGVTPGTLYFYRLDGQKERPDPASRCQPQGVHGPSAVVDKSFPWTDQHWHGIPLAQYIIYELHVGTYTDAGTFAAIVPHLDELKELGVTAIELMPVAQFPGTRNWGYDGVYPFAVQDSYGGPDGLKMLVDACHQKQMSVILDVVYNHLGPEGNYLGDYGPYFTERYKTPWGPAINFDGADSDHVRHYFIQNALQWVDEFHIDGLRLDAVHAILDHSPYPFLQELGVAVHERAQDLNRQIFLFPESAANDSRLIRSRELGGYGLDAQWNDDFHHALRTVLTDERSGYYEDYGQFAQLVKAYREGFVYSGEYSKHRRHRHGTSTKDIPARRFVVFAQNHDQVGNRMFGERLTQLASFEDLKLAAGAVILSPFVPLLFMGEEYGEEAPFPYFISHGDAALVEAVRNGRRAEFASFKWQGEPPDPQDEATFLRAKLNHMVKRDGRFHVLHSYYRELFRLRKELAPLRLLSKQHCEVVSFADERTLMLRRYHRDDEALTVFGFNQKPIAIALPTRAGSWDKVLDSNDQRWQVEGSTQAPPGKLGQVSGSLSVQPKSVIVLVNTSEQRTKSEP